MQSGVPPWRRKLRTLPHEISAYLGQMLQYCLDIRFVWLIGQDQGVPHTAPRWELMMFADSPTLQHLRKADRLHRADVDVLVVTDGDRFESVWGPRRLTGSLVRWAWRQGLAGEAFYNESKWAAGGNDGGVVRVRRKAVLLWQSGARR